MATARLLLSSLLLSACAGGNGLRSHDLGYEYPRTSLPPLRSVSVKAVAPFEGPAMHYRLAYRAPAVAGVFDESRWAAPPADLVRRKILRATPAGTLAKCALEATLRDFTQVFGAKDASEVRVELGVALVAVGQGSVASRTIALSEPNAGASAAGGAAAFARATERAVAELSAWAATQAPCR